jgi:thioredoxin 1
MNTHGIIGLKRAGAAVVLLALLLAGGAASAADTVYDERANAGKDIAAAMKEAARTRKRVVVVFGANWCKDCRALDTQMHQGELAALVEKHFVVVKVDVGRMDKNVDVAAKYGVPVENGIPAVAILDSRGKLLYAQDQGQFASARSLSAESIRAFFEQWK